MWRDKIFRSFAVFIAWHTFYWVSDAAYYHWCAKGYLWSLVTRESEVCQTLKYVSRIVPHH